MKGKGTERSDAQRGGDLAPELRAACLLGLGRITEPTAFACALANAASSSVVKQPTLSRMRPGG